MTQPASSDIAATYPPNNGLRVGIASTAADGSIVVTTAGTDVACGFVDPAGIVDGVPVAILRGESSWLALGAVREQPPTTVLATASSSLVLTTTPTLLPGASISVTVSTTTPYHVIACLDLDISVAGVTVGVGNLLIDTVTQSASALGASQTSVARFSITQQWVGTIGAGTHTFEIYGSKTAAAGTLTLRDVHSTLTVRLGA